VQITVDDVSGHALTFVSAYRIFMTRPIKPQLTGDEGSSGNYFGIIPVAFQVVVIPATI